MIIYNVTANIDEEIHADWLIWMKSKHIPDVMNTGFFLEHKICKVLSTQEGETGHTYAIQYFCNSLDDLNEYQEKEAQKLQQEHLSRYGNKVLAFRTLLEVL